MTACRFENKKGNRTYHEVGGKNTTWPIVHRLWVGSMINAHFSIWHLKPKQIKHWLMWGLSQWPSDYQSCTSTLSKRLLVCKCTLVSVHVAKRDIPIAQQCRDSELLASKVSDAIRDVTIHSTNNAIQYPIWLKKKKKKFFKLFVNFTK